jgi:solute carrier family 25 carnitine/acylcarnitine transporter 20/29
MDTPLGQRRILTIVREIVQREGWRSLFRGLNVTVIRAFPVNGIIFPVYEYTLMQVAALEY